MSRIKYNKNPNLNESIKNLLFDSPKTLAELSDSLKIPKTTLESKLNKLLTQGKVKKDKFNSQSPNRPLYTLIDESEFFGYPDADELSFFADQSNSCLIEDFTPYLMYKESIFKIIHDILNVIENRNNKANFPVFSQIITKLKNHCESDEELNNHLIKTLEKMPTPNNITHSFSVMKFPNQDLRLVLWIIKSPPNKIILYMIRSDTMARLRRNII